MTQDKWKSLNSEYQDNIKKLAKKDYINNIMLAIMFLVFVMLFFWQTVEVYVLLSKNFSLDMWIRLVVGIGLFFLFFLVLMDFIKEYDITKKGPLYICKVPVKETVKVKRKHTHRLGCYQETEYYFYEYSYIDMVTGKRVQCKKSYTPSSKNSKKVENMTLIAGKYRNKFAIIYSNINEEEIATKEIYTAVSILAVIILAVAFFVFGNVDIGFSTLFGRMFVNLFLVFYGVWCIILSIKNKQIAYFIGVFALMFLLVWNTKASSGIFDIIQDFNQGVVTTTGEIDVIIRNHERKPQLTYIAFEGENGNTYERKSNEAFSKKVSDILQTTTKYYQNVGYGKITYYPNTGIIIKVEKR